MEVTYQGRGAGISFARSYLISLFTANLSMAGERVLIVDDDPFTLELLMESLSEQGFSPAAVQDSDGALEALRRDDFRVALIDLSLPGMGGMDLVREVNLTAPETAIVIMTGYPTLESAIQALRQGAYDYIVKPFKIQEVTATLEKALAQQTLKTEVGALRARVRELEQELKRHQEGAAGVGRAAGTPISPGGAYGGRTRGPRTG